MTLEGGSLGAAGTLEDKPLAICRADRTGRIQILLDSTRKVGFPDSGGSSALESAYFFGVGIAPTAACSRDLGVAGRESSQSVYRRQPLTLHSRQHIEIRCCSGLEFRTSPRNVRSLDRMRRGRPPNRLSVFLDPGTLQPRPRMKSSFARPPQAEAPSVPARSNPGYVRRTPSPADARSRVTKDRR